MCFLCLLWLIFFLEVQPQLRLELPVLSSLRLNTAERIRVVDIERRPAHIRVVQNIGRIHSQLEALRFGNPDLLGQGRVECVGSWQLHGRETESAAVSWT